MTYITVSGDMWDKIAFEQMGSESYMSELIQSNYHLIDYVVFPAGIEIKIPEVSDVQEEMPAWREGLDAEDDNLDEFEEDDDE